MKKLLLLIAFITVNNLWASAAQPSASGSAFKANRTDAKLKIHDDVQEKEIEKVVFEKVQFVLKHRTAKDISWFILEQRDRENNHSLSYNPRCGFFNFMSSKRSAITTENATIYKFLFEKARCNANIEGIRYFYTLIPETEKTLKDIYTMLGFSVEEDKDLPGCFQCIYKLDVVKLSSVDERISSS